MRVRRDDLELRLKKSLKSIYWLAGEDPFLLQANSDLIKKIAKSNDFSEKYSFQGDASFSADDFISICQSLSLFSQRKIIELKLPSLKINEKILTALNFYLDQFNPDIILIVISAKLDKATEGSVWFKKVDDQGVVLQLWPMSHQELTLWARKKLDAMNIAHTEPLVSWLIARTEGNLLALNQELEKIELLSLDASPVSGDLNDLKQSVVDEAQFDVFSLTDACLKGDLVRSIRIVRFLKMEGQELTMILWALAREVRILLTLHTMVDNGSGSTKKIPYIPEAKKRLMQSYLTRKNNKFLYFLLRKLNQLDYVVKGVSPGNSWDLLEDFIVSFAR